jgi:hypothetical protein
MKTIVCLTLLFGAMVWADEASDRAAIDKVIVGLNDADRRAELFTKGADSKVDFDRLVELHRKPGGAIGMDETWTQMTVPQVVSGKIRFVKVDVAMVEGASVVEGAVTMVRRVPLLFVMKKEDGKWRVDAVRVMGQKP